MTFGLIFVVDRSYTLAKIKRQYIYDNDETYFPKKRVRFSHEEFSQHNMPKSTRTVKNHPPESVIDDTFDGIKTRSGKANFCAFSIFLAQEEPKSVREALEDENWTLTM